MIDWTNVIFPVTHDFINGGEVISINSDGTQDWRSPKRIKATGSYEKTISIKSYGSNGRRQASDLMVNGNPSKFLQGHNVFGSDDIVSLLFDVFQLIVKQFNLNPTEEEVNRVRAGDYPIGLVDINYSFSLKSRAEVLAFIRALEFKANTRHGRPSMKGGTLYFGKTSTYWAIKFYCKAEEIETTRGKLPLAIKNKGIEEWAENILRIELRLLNKELDRLAIRKVKDLNKATVKQLFNDYLRKINMTDQIKLTSEVMLDMPSKLRSTYTLWSEGHDLRNLMSRRTYYRHRGDLKQFGINIDLRPESIDKPNIVPLIKFVEANPVDVPNWAFEQKLVHYSA